MSTYNSPVDLATAWTDKYGDTIADGDDITALLEDLRDAAQVDDDRLYFRVPGSSVWPSGGTLKCKLVDFGELDEFGCLQSDVPVTIKQDVSRTNLKASGGYTWTQYSGNLWYTIVASSPYAFGATRADLITPIPPYGVSWSRPQAITWQAATGKSVGDYVVPTSGLHANQYRYKCVLRTGSSPYTTGTTEPIWPTTIGQQVVDNEITWECVALFTGDWQWHYDPPTSRLYIYSAVGNPENYAYIDCYIDSPVDLWKVENAYQLVLGTKTPAESFTLTFEGCLSGIMGGWNATATNNWPGGGTKWGGEYTGYRSLIFAKLSAAPVGGWTGSRVDVRCNFYNCYAAGFLVYSAKPTSDGIYHGEYPFFEGYEHVYVSGLWVDGAPAFMNGGCQTIHWEMPKLQDLIGKGQGWNGDISRGYDDHNTGGPRIDWTGTRYPPFIDRMGGGWNAQYCGQCVGGIAIRYGHSQGGGHGSWRWGNAEQLTGSWTSIGNNRWTHPLSQAITDFVTRINDDAGGTGCGAGGRQRNWGPPKAAVGAIARPYDWYATDSLITVYSTADPTIEYDRFYAVIERFYVTAQDVGRLPGGYDLDAVGFPCLSKYSNWAAACPTGQGLTSYAFVTREDLGNWYLTQVNGYIIDAVAFQQEAFVDEKFVGVPSPVDYSKGAYDYPRLNSFSGSVNDAIRGMWLYSQDTGTRMTITGPVKLGHTTATGTKGRNILEYSYVSGLVTAYANEVSNADYLDRVRFTGSPRQVIDVRTGATLYVTAPSFEQAGTWTANGGGTLYVNGVLKTDRPYTFTADDSQGDEWWVDAEYAQVARPIADITTTNWVVVPTGSSFEALNEETVNLADYAFTTTPGAVLEVKLTGLSDPGDGVGHILSYACKGVYTAAVVQGPTPGTVIESWQHNDATPVTHTQVMQNMASITDYTDLRFRITAGS